ncbi:MAG TPA: thioredoxin domain-containing protein [Vicinamibacterales bacterium]|jgi:hypothetical protein|nr:thioredoxin domain-containing protein [Vicinamibacterales bacterium]
MPNRLASERSPYLLQHAQNPVDWYPWGEEAFEKARRDDKPIFLSVGYSTCHWCHVMEHESFESADIAERLNRDFVSIKVDREERPDVDRVYMTFVQATTGAGGWPMSVWLTPSLKPFYGGTYYPPTSRWGRPGFSDVLDELARVWKGDRARVDTVADDLLARIQEATAKSGVRTASEVAGPDAIPAGVEQFRRAFDTRYGGFGDAPKFPRPSELLFLLRAGATEMALETLRAMALGGMRDHVGGGFHRYSVDAAWRVPHFEKMLYDQAQLVLAYLEASQASRTAGGAEGSAGFYATVAEDTLDYVLRDLTDDAGGFYSAEDADSVPPELSAQGPGAPKSEGAFYLWTDDEIGALLGDAADIVRKRFGIQKGGNAPHDPQGEFTGKNILYVDQPIEDIAIRTGKTADEVMNVLVRTRPVLFNAREERPRPHLDDKILTAWNGLMIAAIARAARTFGNDRYLNAARTAARFIRALLWQAETGGTHGRLLRRFRAGEAAIEGYCEDYACLVWGLLELFQADGDPDWLEWAIAVQNAQDALFWDDADAGWFTTSGRDPSVLLRLKEEHDGAEPSPGSISTLNLIVLSHLTGRGELADRAGRTLARYGRRFGEAARALPFMLAALATWHAGFEQIVIVGQPDAPDTKAMHEAVAHQYRPYAVVIPVEPGSRQESLARLIPAIGAMTLRDGRATVYVCRNFTCDEPVTDPARLRR